MAPQPRPVLSREASATLRDQLLAELEGLALSDLDAWTLQAWPKANTLTPVGWRPGQDWRFKPGSAVSPERRMRTRGSRTGTANGEPGDPVPHRQEPAGDPRGAAPAGQDPSAVRGQTALASSADASPATPTIFGSHNPAG